MGVDQDPELARRRALTEDAARADKVAARHGAGGRTARENIAALLDPGSFVEYGRLASAAQEKRFAPEELPEELKALRTDVATILAPGNTPQPASP